MVIKIGRWLLYYSDNIILGLIVVEQMSSWVGLTRKAAETFLYHPPHIFNGIEGDPEKVRGKLSTINSYKNKEF